MNHMMQTIKAIGFDLDDTLWENGPVLKRSIKAQNRVIREYRDDLSDQVIFEHYEYHAKNLLVQDNIKYQNMVQLRVDALKAVVRTLQLEATVALEAFEAFHSTRQILDLDPYAKPLLTFLKEKHLLVTISNGTADLEKIGIQDFFEFSWRAGVHGLAKPHGDMLTKAIEQLGIQPNQFLYVGDKMDVDGAAAKHAGAQSVIVNKEDYQSEDNGYASLQEWLIALKNN